MSHLLHTATHSVSLFLQKKAHILEQQYIQTKLINNKTDRWMSDPLIKPPMLTGGGGLCNVNVPRHVCWFVWFICHLKWCSHGAAATMGVTYNSSHVNNSPSMKFMSAVPPLVFYMFPPHEKLPTPKKFMLASAAYSWHPRTCYTCLNPSGFLLSNKFAWLDRSDHFKLSWFFSQQMISVLSLSVNCPVVSLQLLILQLSLTLENSEAIIMSHWIIRSW